MIRAATLADVPALVALGQQLIAGSSYAGFVRDNPAQMATTANNLIANEAGAVFVSEVDGQVLGMIGVVRFIHHISGDVTVGEIFLFVDPRVRGSAGIRLIAAAKAWAADQGATTFQLVAPEGATRTEQLYAALHFAPIERAWGLALC